MGNVISTRQRLPFPFLYELVHNLVVCSIVLGKAVIVNFKSLRVLVIPFNHIHSGRLKLDSNSKNILNLLLFLE